MDQLSDHLAAVICTTRIRSVGWLTKEESQKQGGSLVHTRVQAQQIVDAVTYSSDGHYLAARLFRLEKLRTYDRTGGTPARTGQLRKQTVCCN